MSGESAIDLDAVFDKFDDEYLKFSRIESAPSRRPDICAFLLLDRLVPGWTDIIGSSEHDEIFLNVDVEKLASCATEENIRYLIRCGVHYGEEGLSMFV